MTQRTHAIGAIILVGALTWLSDCADGQTLSETDTTTAAVQQTRQQIETEKAQFSQDLARQQEWLDKLNTQKQQLANDVVEMTFSIAQKESELQALLERKANAQQQQLQNSRQLTQLRVIAEQAAHVVAETLETSPPSESRSSQQALLDVFNRSNSNPDSPVDPTALVELMASLVREGHTSALFETSITTPEGTSKPVTMLRVGHLFYACRSASGTLYLAAASAETASGFRWLEIRDKTPVRSIENAFQQARSSTAAFTAELPVDVSGRLTAGDLTSTATLLQKLIAGGPVMIPLAIVALVASMLILERLCFIHRQCRSSISTAESILGCCHAGTFEEAAAFASARPKVITNVLSAALRNRHASVQIIEDAIQESMLHELPKIERFLPTIAVLAGVAPLLGLLGTITGMISTFDMITHFGTGQPQLMAGGISEALITTATGLVIAIPVLLMHRLISSKTDQLVADTERYAATLLNLIQEEKQEPAPGINQEKDHES